MIDVGLLLQSLAQPTFASLKQPEQPKQPKGLFTVIGDTFGDDTSPHNCYGMGNKRCITDGYRDPENKQTKSPTGVFERGSSNEINIMYRPVRIYDLQHLKGDSK